MTLVEVIVAMTIFAIMAAAIFGVILHANNASDRSKVRDVELAGEVNTIGRKVNAKLNQVAPGNYTGSYDITFNDGANIDTIGGAKVYETDEGEFSDEFDFKMKTVVKAADLNGLSIDNLNENEYSFTVKNELNVPLTLIVTIQKGFIFEGTGRQYVHTSRTYPKTIPANSELNFGYYCDGYTNSSFIEFRYHAALSSEYVAHFDCTRFDPDDEDKRSGVLKVTGMTDTNPALSSNLYYNGEEET